MAQEQGLAVTQEQLQDVLNKVSDLRVNVAGLTGELSVTNTKLNGTNDKLDTLITHLEEQAKTTLANRKWMIGTAIGSLGLFVTIVALIFRAML